MFRHVAVFEWSDEATEQERAAAVAALEAWAAGPATAFGRLTVGVDAGLADGNGDVVVVMDLPDREAYAAYAVDEAHQTLVREHVRPILRRRTAVQHQL
ncbi:Stress responsive A/B Barrel Domain [Blastococcus sp. DSM 46786]|uniref:Dabb family protein n=1 Tax=Blastococcus sp. DSM 46786 TaxID=1798227 RepID=UPI0008CAF745|nr:Dabb family protein [Blastococcus sp. DSM 46786]SEK20358.1 Stress responsive A/B Barrel Domain [Blastococcus sp. DSM 46786]